MENYRDQDISPMQPDSPVQSWAERNGFADWALAIIWIIVAFILFQIAAGVVAFVLFMMREGMQGQPNPQQMMDAFMQNLDLLFIGNSFGQIVFLGIATWFFSLLHTTRENHTAFLRFQTNKSTPKMLLYTAVLIVGIQPLIWFLGWINMQIPVPENLQNLQSTQLQLIDNFLHSDQSIFLALFHIGLVPAICEETLYRGYVLRAFEKSWGIWIAMVMSGLFFGLYHLQLTNLLPLAFIGIILAYVTYVSNSIFPAMLAHFINNGGSVFVAANYPNSAFAETSPDTMPPIWAVIAGVLISFSLIYYMYQNREKGQGGVINV